MWFLYVVLGVIGLYILINIAVLLVRLMQKPLPDKPEKMKNSTVTMSQEDDRDFTNLYLSLMGKSLNSSKMPTEEHIMKVLSTQAEFINGRFDCSDFRLQLLFRIYKDCSHMLPEKAKELIKNTFLNFKYFMDEPGDDSMCFWSENHQLLFPVSEYLAGQEWPDEIFTNSGINGREHMEKAIKRINAWMKQRFDYGFSEYLSNNYLLEDVGPMSNYICYSKDADSVQKMKIIMDLLWLDVALNCVNNRFAAASSRMYGNNKAGNHLGNSLTFCMNKLWGEECAANLISDDSLSDTERLQAKKELDVQANSMGINFAALLESGLYTLPEVIRKIAVSQEEMEVKMSEGLSPQDLEDENFVGLEDEKIMAQWGAESFTNPQVIENTIKYIRKNKMYKNLFIYYFKFLDLPVFRMINLRKLCEKHELMTHGIALGRGNIYTYRTKYYSMSTLIAKDVDSCGAQEHIWTANLAQNLTLFTTQPARMDANGYGSSPGYWIGNGRCPMSVQDKNVNITIYKLPVGKRLLEFKTAEMTHVYFPKRFYDRVEHKGNMIFAQKDKVLVAVLSDGEMKFKPFCKDSVEPLYKSAGIDAQEKMYQITGEFDLCREGGEYHTYITELSDTDTETFEEFRERIENTERHFDGDRVVYYASGNKIEVSYSGDYLINGEATEKIEKRYDCKFCSAERKAQEINVSAYGCDLHLNYSKGERY